MRKIIIREEQLRLIENLILENKMDDIMSDAKIGDIVFIRHNSQKGSGFNKFEVVEYFRNGIAMRIIERVKTDKSDNLIIFNKEDLVGNDLKMYYIKKPENSKIEGKPKELTIKGIEQIILLTKDNTPKVELIPSEDDNIDNEEPETDTPEEETDIVREFINDINKLEVGGNYAFIFNDGSKINFEVTEKSVNDIKISIKSAGSKEANKFKPLVGNEFIFSPQNNDVNLSNNEDSIDITMDKIKKSKEDDDFSPTITDITDLVKTDIGVDSDKLEDISQYATITPKDALRILKNDPNVMSAFMSKPTFRDLLTNKTPKGLALAADLMNKINRNKEGNIKRNVNDYLKVPEEIRFKILGSSINEIVNGEPYKLSNEVKYNAKNKNRRGTNIVSKILDKEDMWLLIKAVYNEDDGIFIADVFVKQDRSSNVKLKRTKIKIY